MVTKPQYGRSFQVRRSAILADAPPCTYCPNPATIADHVPPVALHAHTGDDAGCCVLVPSCKPCSDRQGQEVRALRQQLQAEWAASGVRQDDPTSIGADLGPDDPVWAERPWIADLLPVPEGSRWPRFMSGPHPDAVGSLGDTVELSAALHGVDLRWWQRFALARLLEVDAAGELVWSEAILSTPRRAGKSWLLRELAWWRMMFGPRFFGEPQTILHTSRTLVVTHDVVRPAFKRAQDGPDGVKVYRSPGRERLEAPDGGQWMILAESGAYGLGAGLAICDEAWDYSVATVTEGIQPTMMERASPQLLLVSTAHRRSTPLIPDRRSAALDELAEPRRRLLLEWSAETTGDLLADAEAASPVWDKARARHVRDALDDARRSRKAPGEIDPLDFFRSQYLNDWEAGKGLGRAPGEPLVTPEAWEAHRRPQEGPYAVVAVEDFYGRSYAVAWAHVDPDSVDITVGAAIVGSRAALADALVGLDAEHVLVGASIVGDPVFDGYGAEPVGSRETKAALAAFRRGVGEDRIFHDGSLDLAEQLAEVRVVEKAEGLAVTAGHRSDLVRAAAWCVAHVDESRVVGPAVL
jgi:hypothetical protein